MLRYIKNSAAFLIYAFIIWLGLFPSVTYGYAVDQHKAVILTYFRIGEHYHPEESLDTAAFLAQMQFLQDKNYKILPLPEIINALKSGETLPERSIAITFEGAHKSILKTAIPYLVSNDIPFTLVLAPSYPQSNKTDYMSWDELKNLPRNLVSYGVLPYSYRRLAGKSNTDIQTEMNLTKITFRENTGSEPEIFVYPYGEYDSAMMKIVQEHGYKAALGMHSGVAYQGSNIFALPRFAITDSHGDPEHFEAIINAHPLPAEQIEPQNPYISGEFPAIGFTIPSGFTADLRALSCYVNGIEKADIEIIGKNRVELRLNDAQQHEKIRINCTLPEYYAATDEHDEGVRWRWIGYLLTYHP